VWGRYDIPVCARGLVLDIFSFVKFRAVFTIARPLFAQRKFSHCFFWFKEAVEMKMNNFLVGDFFIAISVMVVFSLQSENDEILWSFLSINMLWSHNLWGLVTQNLTHIIFNMSTTRFYGWDLNNALLFPSMTIFIRMCPFYYKGVKLFRGYCHNLTLEELIYFKLTKWKNYMHEYGLMIDITNAS